MNPDMDKRIELDYSDSRLSYTKSSIQKLVEETVKKNPTVNALNKKEWFLREINALKLPADLSSKFFRFPNTIKAIFTIY